MRVGEWRSKGVLAHDDCAEVSPSIGLLDEIVVKNFVKTKLIMLVTHLTTIPARPFLVLVWLKCQRHMPGRSFVICPFISYSSL